MSKESRSPATPEVRAASYNKALEKSRTIENPHATEVGSIISEADFEIKRDRLIGRIAVKAATLFDEIPDSIAQVNSEVAHLNALNAEIEDRILKITSLSHTSEQTKTELLGKLQNSLQLNNQKIAEHNEQIALLKDIQLRAESVFDSAVSPAPQPEEEPTEVVIEPPTQEAEIDEVGQEQDRDILDQTEPSEQSESAKPGAILVAEFLLTQKGVFNTAAIRNFLEKYGKSNQNISLALRYAEKTIGRKGYKLLRSGAKLNRIFEVVELSGDERLLTMLEARNVTPKSLEYFQAFLQLHKDAIAALISTDEDAESLKSCLDVVTSALEIYEPQKIEKVKNITLTRNRAVRDIIACFKSDRELVEELKAADNSLLRAFGMSLSLLNTLDILASKQRKIPYESQEYSAQLLKYVAEFEAAQRKTHVSDQTVVLTNGEVAAVRDRTPVIPAIENALTGQKSRKNS